MTLRLMPWQDHYFGPECEREFHEYAASRTYAGGRRDGTIGCSFNDFKECSYTLTFGKDKLRCIRMTQWLKVEYLKRRYSQGEFSQKYPLLRYKDPLKPK
jgi:hypothetical protein